MGMQVKMFTMTVITQKVAENAMSPYTVLRKLSRYEVTLAELPSTLR